MDPVISPVPNGKGGSHSPVPLPADLDIPFAEVVSPPLPPSRRRPAKGAGERIKNAVGHNNPFYLMSAACMLGGCLLLTNSLSWSPIGRSRLLMLLATINIYELLLLGLGLFLLKINGHPQRRRDSAQLLVLAAIFMCDAAFLVSEVVSTQLALGAVLSATLLVAAIAKVAVVLRMAGARLDAGRWIVITGMLTALFGIPSLLKWIGDTHVTGGHLYAAWWAAALLWIAYDVVSQLTPKLFPGRMPVTPVALFIVVPFVSLLTHIGILHYVYNQSFYAPQATPMLLSLMLIIARQPLPANPEAAITRRFVLVALPVISVFTGAQSRPELAWVVRGVGALTPWMFSLAGAYLIVVWVFWPKRIVTASVGGALGVVAYVLGPTSTQVWAAANWIWSAITSGISATGSGIASVGAWLWSLLPRTAGQWGTLAVTCSFVLLGVGARVSLKHRKGIPEPEQSGGTAT